MLNSSGFNHRYKEVKLVNIPLALFSSFDVIMLKLGAEIFEYVDK